MFPHTPSLASSALKVALLAICGVLNYIGFVPPRMSPPLVERRRASADSSTRYKMGMGLARLNGIMLFCPSVEAAVIILQSLPPTVFSDALLSILIPSSVPRPLPLALTARFLLGSSLITAGVALRVWSYHTLGRFFTLEVSLQKGHRLVTTGPYAFVRHPSYTGGVLFIFGDVVTVLGRGTYLGELGVWRSIVGSAAIGAIIGAWTYFCALLIPRRAGREDKMLREEFGEEWEKWAQGTPYSLFPYVW